MRAALSGLAALVALAAIASGRQAGNGAVDTGAALEALKTQYPDAVMVGSLGRATSGNELWHATVGRGADVADRPTILFVEYARDGDGRGTGDALAVLRRLLASSQSDLTTKRLLDDVAIVFVPALDPDLAVRTRPGPPSALDRDFPLGWEPLGDEPATEGRRSGPYPLHRPEAQAFAAYLEERTNVAAVVTWANDPDPEGEPPARAGLLSSLGDVDPRLRARPARSLEPRPGGLVRWCRDGLGLPVVALASPSVVAGEDVETRATLRKAAVDVVVQLALGLPRLEVTTARVEDLGADLWTVDLVVRNAGAASTALSASRARPGGDEVEVALSGVVVQAIALRPSGETDFSPVAWGEREVRIGHLDGGEYAALRLVVAGPEGTPVAAEAKARRALSAFATVSLAEGDEPAAEAPEEEPPAGSDDPAASGL